jgi:pimeloyl-ACP methyl ester carboxylesterase
MPLIIFIALSFSVAAALASRAGAEEVRLEFGDLTLSANLSLAEGKTLQDEVMLITHGTLAHSKMALIGSLQELLNEAGYSSLAINLSLGAPDREFMYDCAVPHTHLFHDAMKEIGAWLDWLGRKGAKDIVLMGHSRGGNQTAWFAADNDAVLVSKIVLLAPATWDQARAAKGFRKTHGKALADVLAKAQALVDQGQGETMMENVGLLYCRGASVTAASFLSYYQPDERRHTPALLARLKRPVLIIAGSEDKVVRGLGELVPPHLNEETQRFEIIDGASHFFRDLYTEDVVDLIVEFLSGD